MKSDSTVAIENIRNCRIKLVQLAEVLIFNLKIKRNDDVLIYSALTDYNLIDSSFDDLTFLLKMLVGTGGTIVMSSVVSGKTDLLWGEKANRISDPVSNDAESVEQSRLHADLSRLNTKIIGLGVSLRQLDEILPGKLHPLKSDPESSASGTMLVEFNRNEIPFFLIEANKDM